MQEYALSVPNCPRMRPTFLFLCLLLALTLAGCAHKPPYVGTWVGPHILPGSAGSIPSSITLRDDGTFTTTVGQGRGASGTYSVQGSQITQTFTSNIVDGRTIDIPQHDAVTQTGTFHVQGDKLTLNTTDGSAPTVLTRQK